MLETRQVPAPVALPELCFNMEGADSLGEIVCINTINTRHNRQANDR